MGLHDGCEWHCCLGHSCGSRTQRARHCHHQRYRHHLQSSHVLCCWGCCCCRWCCHQDRCCCCMCCRQVRLRQCRSLRRRRWERRWARCRKCCRRQWRSCPNRCCCCCCQSLFRHRSGSSTRGPCWAAVGCRAAINFCLLLLPPLQNHSAGLAAACSAQVPSANSTHLKHSCPAPATVALPASCAGATLVSARVMAGGGAAVASGWGWLLVSPGWFTPAVGPALQFIRPLSSKQIPMKCVLHNNRGGMRFDGGQPLCNKAAAFAFPGAIGTCVHVAQVLHLQSSSMCETPCSSQLQTERPHGGHAGWQHRCHLHVPARSTCCFASTRWPWPAARRCHSLARHVCIHESARALEAQQHICSILQRQVVSLHTGT